MFNGVMTEEQKQQALLARKEKREAGMAMFKTSWLDDLRWVELAREAGEFLGTTFKLPQHHIPPSGRKLDKLAEQLGVELGEPFFGINTKNTTAAIKKENLARPVGSKYNYRAYVGHVLELWKEKQNVQ